MAITYSNIEWYYKYDPLDNVKELEAYLRRYGIANVGGDRWAVVEDDSSTPHLIVKNLTTVTGRQTAMGFIKLLTGK